MMFIIDKLIDAYNQYYSQFIAWYNAASDVTQIAFIIVAGFIALVIAAMFVLSRITK